MLDTGETSLDLLSSRTDDEVFLALGDGGGVTLVVVLGLVVFFRERLQAMQSSAMTSHCGSF